MPDLDAVKAEILSRLDIKSEYTQMGVQFTGSVSSSGWHPCKSVYKSDKNPSAGIFMGQGTQRGYYVIFNQSAKGKPRLALSFFDFASENGPGRGDFYQTLKYYAAKTNVNLSGKTKEIPKETDVKKYVKDLTADVRDYLNNKRGLTDETIKKFEIGWCLKKGRKAQRNSFPCYDENNDLINIRFHNSKKKPKTLNLAGCGEARLWNVHNIVNAPDKSIVVITEGEFDAMLCHQETGLITGSPTNGTLAFKTEWVKYFNNKHVVLLWDCDQEGRDTVKNLLLPTFKKAILSGEVLSIKIIWLFDKVSKVQNDFTDFIVKAGGTAKEILEKIKNTKPYKYPVIKEQKLQDIIELDSFSSIDKTEYLDKRVTVPIVICGENSKVFFAPSEVEVVHCSYLNKSKCHGREDWPYLCDEPIKIPADSIIALSCVNTNELQFLGSLRRWLCDKNQQPTIKIPENKGIALREIFAHQTVKTDTGGELSVKTLYVSGPVEKLKIGQYQATGVIRSNPKNHQPTMIVDDIQKKSEEWETFDLDKNIDKLKEVKKLTPSQICADLAYHTTRIYERADIHMGVLLTLCSPLEIDMLGEGKIRGFVSAAVIGDTGTGKSAVSDQIFKSANVGMRLSGMTASRTGITYAIEQTPQGAWQIKAGALLEMTRQALIIDEAQDVPEEDLKTMAEAIDSGFISIAKVERGTYEAKTRPFFALNPVDPHRKSNQRSMDSFRYPCKALMDIFPAMMVRRIDLFLFATTNDIRDKSKIYNPEIPDDAKEQRITPDRLRALIHYAWNLKSEQIIITSRISTLIKEVAGSLAKKFGQCSDLAIVYPEDFRKTLCRLCVAMSIIDLNSDDDFKTITVTADCVMYVEWFITGLYSHQNCRLNEYSRSYKETHYIEDYRKLFDDLISCIYTDEEKGIRIKKLMGELLTLEPNGKEKVQQKQLADFFEVSIKTISRDLLFFVKNKLVNSSRGYRPTTKLIQFYTWLEQNESEWLIVPEEEV